jgi:hypothetical protein
MNITGLDLSLLWLLFQVPMRAALPPNATPERTQAGKCGIVMELKQTNGGGMAKITGRLWGIVFLLLVCALPAGSQVDSNRLVQELFAKSGLDQLIEQLPMIVQEGMHQAFAQNQDLKKIPPQAFQAMMDAAASAYESQKLRSIMLRSFAGKMDDAEIRSVIQWLDSPTGVKCTDLEKQSLTAEAFQELSRFAEEIQKKPPRPERLKLIGELDRATKATATSVEIFINSNLAVATAISLSLPQESPMPLSEIRKKFEAGRADIENALQEQTRLSLLYTYRLLSDSEIKEYIKMADSPAGSKFNAVGIEAFQKAMVEGGMDFGQAVAKVFENVNPKKEI